MRIRLMWVLFLLAVLPHLGCDKPKTEAATDREPTSGPSTGPAEEEFKVEEFEFAWTLMKVGEMKLQVHKDEDGTSIRLWGASSFLDMSPATAEAVGAALARTAEFEAKIRGGGAGTSQEVAAGDHQVEFSLNPELGFRVWIRRPGRYGSILLKAAEARTFAPHLAKSRRLAAFVDSKVRF